MVLTRDLPERDATSPYHVTSHFCQISWNCTPGEGYYAKPPGFVSKLTKNSLTFPTELSGVLYPALTPVGLPGWSEGLRRLS